MSRQPPPAHRPTPRRASPRMPTFALYGEEGSPPPELLHIESIYSRSRLYDWEIDTHVHRGLHQLLWLRAGQVEAMLDESRVRYEGPVVFAIPPGVPHAFRFSRDADGYVLTVDAAVLAEGEAVGVGEALHTLFTRVRSLVLDPSATEVVRLHALFEVLHAENHAAGEAGGPVPRWLACAIVWRLAQLHSRGLHMARDKAAGGRHSVYTRWLVLLEANYRAHWPVSRYAEQLGLSTERLNRIVRAQTGHNAQRLIHDRLAREASRWLVHVAAPVSRLAFELGFNDPAYFCRFFKRHTGLSPRAYRQRAQRGDEGRVPSGK